MFEELRNDTYVQVNKLKISVLKFCCKPTKPPKTPHSLASVTVRLPAPGNRTVVARVPQERQASQRTLQEASQWIFRTTPEGMASYRLHLIAAALRHRVGSCLAQGHTARGWSTRH